ncbi:MAG TPA: V-type ATPase subunit, partial [bacterium]|nr:V-type ATPase subunit [bacterium]
MYAQFLTPDDIQMLVKADGLAEYFKSLRKTAYSEFLSGIRQDEITAPLMESVLFAALFDCYQKIVPSLSDPRDAAFLKKLLLIFELRNVKTIMRGKITGRPADEIRMDLVNIGRYTVGNMEMLLNLKDTDEVVAYL